MLIPRVGFNWLPPNSRRVGSSSTNASVTYTASGAVTKTGTKKFGTASMYVATSNDEIYTANNTTYMNYGTTDFTIEWWMYFDSLSGHSSSCDLLANDVAGGLGIRIAQAFNTNGLSSANPKYINVFARQQADLDYWTLTTNWAASQWYFCVLQRKQSVISFWLDGVLQARTTGGGGTAATRNFASASGTNIKIGTADGGNGVGPAYIDEVCFSNTYRYEYVTRPIPVPTAAFTLDSYTTQLLHMDGVNDGTTFTNETS